MFGAAPTGVASPPTDAANVVINNRPVAYVRLTSGPPGRRGSNK